jgi:hypothetical protein
VPEAVPCDDPRAEEREQCTTTADGTVETFPPALVFTLFGPNTASNSTASQMTMIDKAAHISVTRSSGDQRRFSWTTAGGSCERVDINALLSIAHARTVVSRRTSGAARIALGESRTPSARRG